MAKLVHKEQSYTGGGVVTSNPNLLDNPWFTINQRGQSSYNNTAKFSTMYSVDRWLLFNENIDKTFNTSLTVNADNSITFATNQNSSLLQKIESSTIKALEGKTVTLSIELGDNSYIVSSSVIPTLSSSFAWVINTSLSDDFSVQMIVSTTSCLIAIIAKSQDKTQSITIKAIKLEIGSVSTLHLDTAPNYASELLKCQRYFISTKTENTPIFGYIHSDTVARVSFPLNTEMRTVPVIVNSLLNTNAQLLYKGTGYTFTGQNLTFRIITMNSIACVIEISGFANLPTSEVCVLKTNGNVLALSADL